MFKASFIFSLIVETSFCLLLLTACRRDERFETKLKPEVILNASNPRTSSDQIHLSNDTVYIIASNLVRFTGQSLKIDAGTIVKMKDKMSITIQAGATIDATGTESSPIIFTSDAEKGSAGYLGTYVSEAHYWNGINIYGNAGSGGASSGSLSFVRIEYAGGNSDQLGLPALLLSDVSKETSISNVQISYSYNTVSFEFRGGDVNAKNLVSYASLGTDFYFNTGYKGMLQQVIAFRHPYFPANISTPGTPLVDALAGVVIEGEETFPIISNLSVLGPNLQPGTGVFYLSEPPTKVAALVTNFGGRFKLRNSVLMGFPKTAYFINDKEGAYSLNDHETELYYTIFHSNDTARTFYLTPELSPINSTDLKNFEMRSELHNEIFLNASRFGFDGLANYDNPDLKPIASSPLQDGANFDDIFSDPFFSKVKYRGAIGDKNWLEGWASLNSNLIDYNH